MDLDADPVVANGTAKLDKGKAPAPSARAYELPWVSSFVPAARLVHDVVLLCVYVGGNRLLCA